MVDEGSDEALRQFLLEHVESYDQLQSLLVIAKEPATRWSADRIAEKLGLPQASAQSAWQHLVRRQLVEDLGPGGDARFAHSVERAALLEQLDRRCSSEPHVVLRWMNAHAMQRVRNDALRAFADAFLLGKKKPGG